MHDCLTRSGSFTVNLLDRRQTLLVDHVAYSREHPLTDVSFTLDESQGTLAMNLLRAAEEKIGYTRLDYNSEVGKLSLVGAGMKTNTGVAFQFFQALADANINVDMISTSEVRISIVTSVDKLDEAVRAVHTAFDLDSSEEATVYGGTGR